MPNELFSGVMKAKRSMNPHQGDQSRHSEELTYPSLPVSRDSEAEIRDQDDRQSHDELRSEADKRTVSDDKESFHSWTRVSSPSLTPRSGTEGSSPSRNAAAIPSQLHPRVKFPPLQTPMSHEVRSRPCNQFFPGVQEPRSQEPMSHEVRSRPCNQFFSGIQEPPNIKEDYVWPRNRWPRYSQTSGSNLGSPDCFKAKPSQPTGTEFLDHHSKYWVSPNANIEEKSPALGVVERSLPVFNNANGGFLNKKRQQGFRGPQFITSVLDAERLRQQGDDIRFGGQKAVEQKARENQEQEGAAAYDFPKPDYGLGPLQKQLKDHPPAALDEMRDEIKESCVRLSERPELLTKMSPISQMMRDESDLKMGHALSMRKYAHLRDQILEFVEYMEAFQEKQVDTPEVQKELTGVIERAEQELHRIKAEISELQTSQPQSEQGQFEMASWDTAGMKDEFSRMEVRLQKMVWNLIWNIWDQQGVLEVRVSELEKDVSRDEMTKIKAAISEL